MFSRVVTIHTSSAVSAAVNTNISLSAPQSAINQNSASSPPCSTLDAHTSSPSCLVGREWSNTDVIVSYFVAYAVETRERPCFLMVLVLTWTCSCATRAVLIHEYRSWPDSLKDDVRPTTCYVVMTFYVLLLFADSYVVIVSWIRSNKSSYDVSAPAEKNENDDEANMVFRHAYANLFSKMSYWWFGTQILQVGYKKPLQQSDLGPIPKIDSSDVAYRVFKAAWQKEVAQAQIGQREPSMGRALARTLWKTTAFSGLLLAIGYALKFYGPLAIGLIVQYAEDYKDDKLRPNYTDDLTLQEFFSNGYVVAVMFLLTTVAFSVFTQYHHLIMFRVGVFMQTGIRAMVYEKSLRLANWSGGQSGLTTGLLINHMSSDTESFPPMGFLVNQVWAIPLLVVASIIILVFVLGWSALIACVVMLAMIPIQGKIAAILSRYQQDNLKLSDERLKKVNELLQGMKLLKLYAWEESFRKAVEVVRQSELKVLLKLTLLRGMILFITNVTPVLITLVAFGMYTVLSDDPLTAGKAFTALALFNLMRSPMLLLPFLINIMVTSHVSLKRLNKFFCARELKQPLKGQSLSRLKLEAVESRNLPDGLDAEITNGTFCWEEENQQQPTLSDINISIPQGKLTMVVGRVGSGKSSLLSALLGEMSVLSGAVTWRDQNVAIAYGSQKAWLLNDSLKQNILFGKDLDNEKYSAVLEACALNPDLEVLPAGDDTEIGEKGINLSGGQKQRVSVARAIYSNSRVVLLDDPLSAVDVHVAEQMFEKGIVELLLKQGRTVVLATHHLRYLNQADVIVVMEHGRVSHCGTYNEICERDAKMRRVFQYCNSLEDDGDDNDDDNDQQPVEENNDVTAFQHQISRESVRSSRSGRSQHNTDQKSLASQWKGKKDGELMSKEEREIGSVSFRVYLRYFGSYGLPLLLLVVCTAVVIETLQAGTDFWLSNWSTANSSDPTEKGTNYYIGGYSILSSLTVLAGLLFSLAFAFATIRASRNIHAAMLNRIVLAPVRFFETTPVGRILNRFSSDTRAMDLMLPVISQLCAEAVMQVITAFIVIAVVTPFFLLAGGPVFIVFYIVQYYFRRSQREIQRTVSVTRSPIYANFSEMLSGLSTIRAYRRQVDFRRKVRREINDHASAVLSLQTGNRWLGVRLEFLGGIVVLFAALSSLSAALSGTIGAGLVGLAVAYSLKIVLVLNWLIRHVTDVEINMNAVERINYYSRIDIEPQPSLEDMQLPIDWPARGAIEIRNLEVRYSKGLDPALHGVTASVNSGEKVGICGRTGSGKSSMMLALFRIIEICRGDIAIDGINISQIALQKLRSRLAIIPQDPVLFAGSVRYNLDPLDHHGEKELWESLEVAQLHSVVSKLDKGLDSEVSEGGDNFSVGQRQLFCLARAFLRKTQILVMDEATASVDVETDAIIQKVIRSVFAERTVLTIAHRVATILDSDRILVLDNGKVVENDSPRNLLSKSNGIFASLVHSNK
ncbi:ATP-binding cassette sub-family C member 9-like isoform X2 [Corticium candelabrum]|uniref:ATP-binding cassette sub-family C member 9-like isoform X2 n=1 Tax=Corticium candelabrum TaxID=121492 RepID=UPI002E27066C|nr:ATP-binding cassette sub-family C member 9-like isoform X2 [Corticium candelabrum]